MSKLQKAKLAGGAIAAVFAAVGGVTSIGFLQKPISRAADYAAKAVDIYCELPQSDRVNFRTFVDQRTENSVRVECIGDKR